MAAMAGSWEKAERKRAAGWRYKRKPVPRALGLVSQRWSSLARHATARGANAEAPTVRAGPAAPDCKAGASHHCSAVMRDQSNPPL